MLPFLWRIVLLPPDALILVSQVGEHRIAGVHLLQGPPVKGQRHDFAGTEPGSLQIITQEFHQPPEVGLGGVLDGRNVELALDLNHLDLSHVEGIAIGGERSPQISQKAARLSDFRLAQHNPHVVITARGVERDAQGVLPLHDFPLIPKAGGVPIASGTDNLLDPKLLVLVHETKVERVILRQLLRDLPVWPHPHPIPRPVAPLGEVVTQELKAPKIHNPTMLQGQ